MHGSVFFYVYYSVMGRSIDPGFYKTSAWRDCRESYIRRHPLCERCLEAGFANASRIVHHIKELTPDNVIDPVIAYGDGNLQAVCFACHEEIHGRTKAKRYYVDEMGNVYPR